MLMMKYIFLVHVGADGYHHSVVTRISDGAQKYFFQCGGTMAGLEQFFSSMTDELIESCFPRLDKKGKEVGNFDCWQFIGANPDRVDAERLARIDLTKVLSSTKI